jgi:hypothetical protein
MIDKKAIESLVEECLNNNKIDFLTNLIFTLQQNYTELAELTTDGNYHQGWTHTMVLDYITYEL